MRRETGADNGHTRATCVYRQFLVGTEVEYLPLSLVRDTCAVKVDRRDDVHSKQRLGDLPKPLRWGGEIGHRQRRIILVLSLIFCVGKPHASARDLPSVEVVQSVGYANTRDAGTVACCGMRTGTAKNKTWVGISPRVTPLTAAEHVTFCTADVLELCSAVEYDRYPKANITMVL